MSDDPRMPQPLKGANTLLPDVQQWATEDIIERTKQLRLLTIAEQAYLRNRAASGTVTVFIVILGFGALATVLGILARVFFIDWVLAGCR